MLVDYGELSNRIKAVCEGEDDIIAKMATITCEVYYSDDRFDWVGFYRNVGNETLKIGPYQGGHGCLTIPFSKGVCGAAARTKSMQLVADVDNYPGHIACSSSTESELVLPVLNRAGELLGVFDLDSNQREAFKPMDAENLSLILTEAFG